MGRRDLSVKSAYLCDSRPAGWFFYSMGSPSACRIKALRAGCTRRNKVYLPLCGIAAMPKVFISTSGESSLPTA